MFVPVRYKRLVIIAGFSLLLTFLSLYSVSSTVQEKVPLHTIPENIRNYFYNQDDTLTNSNPDLKDYDYKDISYKEESNIKFNQNFQNFYTDIFEFIHSFKHEIPHIEIKNPLRDNKPEFLNKDSLQNFLKLDKEVIKNLNQFHSSVVNKISSLKKIYKKNNLYSKENGIVMIGGEEFSWLSILSIKSIRSFGCTLPIELIIPTKEEYEYDLCQSLLPSLNGKCVLLNEVLGSHLYNKLNFKGYQYKSLAILASSFDNILFLDSDNILLTDPEEFFFKDPYKSNGLVLWPDYWERTTSPDFYEIVGSEISNLQIRDGKWPLKNPILTIDEKKVKYHDLQGTLPDLSSESGQLLIRKSDHLGTVLLSFLYNYYGPNFFYPLLSLGASGEGDKDTFIAGAEFSDENYYQIKSGIQSFGWFDEGTFHGVSMGQRNPIEDFENYNDVLKSGTFDFTKFDDRNASVFTVHANYPKLNPYLLYKENKLINSKGETFRMYGDIYKFLPHLVENGQYYDFELIQYRRMKFLLCEENISLKYNNFNDISKDELCKFIDDHLDYLQKNPIEKFI
ncbi:hypothetical protein WICMUC_004401 [Wickerhamomyces mucosus]|uniref:Alpha-1,2-mannosyltransferase n=1 Tax=Wickerhamomyces mucosus TaxID=1378264 RepID=A0A9P8TAR9_9ASCO|nr:hypothetical protein WICMUC_004401 [Wickerhamomyces mucosus]